MSDDQLGDAFADQPKKTKADRSGRRASRSLRRARSIYEESGWQSSTEAAFLVQEAMVLAMTDLADAIRAQGDQPR